MTGVAKEVKTIHKTTDNIRIEFDYANHKVLWGWLVKHPGRDKEDWPGWEINGGKYKKNMHLCFACEACGGDCVLCPLKWQDECGTCRDVFIRWQDETDAAKKWYSEFGEPNEDNLAYAKKLALEILNTPVR